MFNPFKKDSMDEEIDRLTAILKETDPTSDNYHIIAENLKSLTESRGVKHARAISAETILTIGANVAIALIVLNYEHSNVITTKAFSFIKGGRS